MASPEQEAAVAAAIVEDVMRQQGGGCGGSGGGGDTVGSWRNLDIAWRKAEEAGESRCISFLGEKNAFFLRRKFASFNGKYVFNLSQGYCVHGRLEFTFFFVIQS
jgi:hypothetical protein